MRKPTPHAILAGVCCGVAVFAWRVLAQPQQVPVIYTWPPTTGRTWAVVTGHVDGDTIKLALLAGIGSCRLVEINAPERKEPGWQAATDRLAALAPYHTLLQVDLRGKDKYGRQLVDLLDAEGKSIGQRMLDEGLARKYRD